MTFPCADASLDDLDRGLDPVFPVEVLSCCTGALSVGRIGQGVFEDRLETIAASKHQLLVDPGLYRIFNQIPNWFREKHGNTQCRELTAPWESDWHCRERAMLCRQLIAETAGFAVQLMLLSESERSKLEFGETVDPT